jgi:uncharacterized protein YdgA (DUF945 family)
MKKLAILFGGLLVLLLIVFFGLPGILGAQVDKRLYEIVDQDIFAQYVDLELIDFEPGWFRSRARLSAKTGGPMTAFTGLRADSEEPIIFDVQLVHGPILFGDQFSFGVARFINTAELPMPEKIFDGPPGSFNLKTSMTLRLDGGTDLTVSSAPRHYSLVQRSSFRPDEIRTRFELDWGGFDADFSMPAGAQALEVSIALQNGLFEVTEKNIKSEIRYGAIRLEGNYEMWRGYPAFGTGSFSWEGLDIDIPDPAVNLKFAMRRLFVAAETKRASGLVSYTANLELDAVHMDIDKIEPFDINDADFEMLVSGVKEAVYGELIELQSQAPLAMMGMVGSRDLERRSEAMTKQFFRDGFEFRVPLLDVSMDQGAMHYDHVFEVAEGAIEDINDQASAKAMDFVANFWIDRALALWLSEFTSRIQMGMSGRQPNPQEMREMAEQTIGEMISEGYIQENGERLETRILLKNGIFSVGRKVVEDFTGS